MPTPFYHISLAEDLLRHPRLPERTGAFLQAHRPAFLLGNTAPDVQTVSGQKRAATHFFDLPLRPGQPPAWERMLAAYPSLEGRLRQAGPAAAFLAGYLCHLQADWYWIVQIFAPVFGPHAGWADFRQRLYLHNVLRSYLDEQILPSLSPRLGEELAGAVACACLPFVKDEDLLSWRDVLAAQLAPGAAVRTVEVFAARQGAPAEQFYRLLRSEERMEAEIFTRLPRQSLARYHDRLLVANLRLLNRCFNRERLPAREGGAYACD
mgnify:CR=1 FL=1